MFFEWGIQGQKFTGAILGGTGKYAGASGEFRRERLLAISSQFCWCGDFSDYFSWVGGT